MDCVFCEIVNGHIKNVYSDKELLPEATVAKFATVQIEGDILKSLSGIYF